MRYFRSTLLLMLALWAGAAEAQTRADLERCRAIQDNARRLACYDGIRLSQAPQKYERVDLAELKSFALTYRGDLVEVAGWIKPGDELLFLGLDEADARPVPIEIDALSRRERQSFLSACGSGCEATVQGRVRPVNFTTGIVADALIAH